ncbi:MAG: ImmA/IrrE family metallo-endopeptidase [Rhodobacteraceae bacterium]|nr:ImmA/IrrE family metallo-endopeptidase [Paracoccaceae bacterium]
MTTAPVTPECLRRAVERSGRSRADLLAKFPKLPEWERGASQPTLRQAQAFARAVYVPVGALFLSRPMDAPLPIPDFRTLPSRSVTGPSPNLLEAIYTCQERQNWYRDFARATGQPERAFIGGATPATPPAAAAADIGRTLGFTAPPFRGCAIWADALRMFIRHAEQAGVLVMVSGIVRSNTRRRLDVDEFRGFALADPLAPLIFINGADTKAAQMFTLAHELAHLWLGATALSNPNAAPEPGRQEMWCNAVAADLLVPMGAFRESLNGDEPRVDALERLARLFKVSALVILRRLLDAGRIDHARFDHEWNAEIKRGRDRAGQVRQSGGGDFHRTTLSRVGRRFARALITSTLEGQTLYRDAFQMLGISKTETLNKLGHAAGVLE